MSKRIAIIGGGPTAVYALAALAETRLPLVIDLYERESAAGPGMPYRPGMNMPQMLSNIASREIPPVRETLLDWLLDLDDEQRRSLGLRREDLTEDAFYPRVVIGAYYTAQLSAVVARARGRGHAVELFTRTRVTDVVPGPAGIAVRATRQGIPGEAAYDHAVIATGHDWPDQTDENGVTLISPWPAHKLRRLAGRSVGILGTSLSAIDVCVALAQTHGRFTRGEGGGLAWAAKGDPGDFHLTLLSRRGLIPEADWWYPLPLPELAGFDDAFADAALAKGADGLLDRAFAAFARAVAAADPAYAGRLGGALRRMEDLAAAHFAERLAAEPFAYARANLAEARQDRRRRRCVPWRLALLRAHEVFERLTPYFGEADLDRFDRHLKSIFTDGYASVPHRSIERLLALQDAGRLDILSLGADGARFARDGDRIVLEGEGGRSFDAIVDARGQRKATLADLGFPELARRAALGPGGSYLLDLPPSCPGSVHCLALPVLLRRRPFVQGLVNAHEMGAAAAGGILERVAGEAPLVA